MCVGQGKRLKMNWDWPHSHLSPGPWALKRGVRSQRVGLAVSGWQGGGAPPKGALILTGSESHLFLVLCCRFTPAPSSRGTKGLQKWWAHWLVAPTWAPAVPQMGICSPGARSRCTSWEHCPLSSWSSTSSHQRCLCSARGPGWDTVIRAVFTRVYFFPANIIVIDIWGQGSEWMREWVKCASCSWKSQSLMKESDKQVCSCCLCRGLHATNTH